MPRAYLRLDPSFFEKKAFEQSYPAGALATLVGVFCLAEHQPERGRFRNERVLRALLEDYAKWIPFLIEKGDVVLQPDGRLYPPGWDEWQEGDWKVGERVARIRQRRARKPKAGAAVTVGVTVPTVTPVTDPTVTSDSVTTESLDAGPTESSVTAGRTAKSGAVHSGASTPNPLRKRRGRGRATTSRTYDDLIRSDADLDDTPKPVADLEFVGG